MLAFLVSVKQRRSPILQPLRVQQPSLSQITTPTGSIPNSWYLRIPVRGGGPLYVSLSSVVLAILPLKNHQTSEKRTTSQQGTTGLSQMCPLIRGFTVFCSAFLVHGKCCGCVFPPDGGEMGQCYQSAAWEQSCSATGHGRVILHSGKLMWKATYQCYFS